MKIPAREIACYVLKYCKKKKKPVTNLELQKLLYFIQIELIRESKDIILDNFEAWRFGPVIRGVYYDYCINGPYPITDIFEENEKFISKDIKKIIDKVIRTKIRKIKTKPWDIAKYIQREEGAWNIVYDNGNGNKKIISKELIKEKEL